MLQEVREFQEVDLVDEVVSVSVPEDAISELNVLHTPVGWVLCHLPQPETSLVGVSN